MSATIVAAVGATVVGSALSSRAAKKAGAQQRDASQQEIDLQRETRDMSMANLRPFLEAGQAGLGGLAELANTQLDPNQFYNDYFKSNEYGQLSEQARRNVLAGSEATGGLRTTSTANMLGSIAPQLAQSAFARQQALQDANYNRQMGLVNVGLNAAGGTNAAAGNAANSLSSAYRNMGSINAGTAAAPYQGMANIVNAAGGAAVNYFSNRNGTGGGMNNSRLI